MTDTKAPTIGIREFTIGRLSKETRCKVPTIRYYEQVGLLSEAKRNQGNQRIYGQSDVDRLAFIRHSRHLGFSIEAIADLLKLSAHPTHSCEKVDVIAKTQLHDVQRRITQLQTLETELTRMVDHHHNHGRIEDCHVIQVLNDHVNCSADDHISIEKG
jgi:DNA-binding transcriptional MerR regulator